MISNAVPIAAGFAAAPSGGMGLAGGVPEGDVPPFVPFERPPVEAGWVRGGGREIVRPLSGLPSGLAPVAMDGPLGVMDGAPPVVAPRAGIRDDALPAPALDWVGPAGGGERHGPPAKTERVRPERDAAPVDGGSPVMMAPLVIAPVVMAPVLPVVVAPRAGAPLVVSLGAVEPRAMPGERAVAARLADGADSGGAVPLGGERLAGVEDRVLGARALRAERLPRGTVGDDRVGSYEPRADRLDRAGADRVGPERVGVDTSGPGWPGAIAAATGNARGEDGHGIDDARAQARRTDVAATSADHPAAGDIAATGALSSVDFISSRGFRSGGGLTADTKAADLVSNPAVFTPRETAPRVTTEAGAVKAERGVTAGDAVPMGIGRATPERAGVDREAVARGLVADDAPVTRADVKDARRPGDKPAAVAGDAARLGSPGDAAVTAASSGPVVAAGDAIRRSLAEGVGVDRKALDLGGGERRTAPVSPGGAAVADGPVRPLMAEARAAGRAAAQARTRGPVAAREDAARADAAGRADKTAGRLGVPSDVPGGAREDLVAIALPSETSATHPFGLVVEDGRPVRREAAARVEVGQPSEIALVRLENVATMTIPTAREAVKAAGEPGVADVPPARQIAAAVIANIGDAKEVTVQLRPDSLGLVRIHIEQTPQGVARVAITVERPETLRLLRDDQEALTRALDRAGLAAEGRTVSLKIAETAQAFSVAPHRIEAATAVAPAAGPGAGSMETASGDPGRQNSTGHRTWLEDENRGRYPAVMSGQTTSRPRFRRSGLDITA